MVYSFSELIDDLRELARWHLCKWGYLLTSCMEGKCYFLNWTCLLRSQLLLDWWQFEYLKPTLWKVLITFIRSPSVCYFLSLRSSISPSFQYNPKFSLLINLVGKDWIWTLTNMRSSAPSKLHMVTSWVLKYMCQLQRNVNPSSNIAESHCCFLMKKHERKKTESPNSHH